MLMCGLIILTVCAVDAVGYVWHRFVAHGDTFVARPHKRHHEDDYPPQHFFSETYRANYDPAWYVPAALSA